MCRLVLQYSVAGSVKRKTVLYIPNGKRLLYFSPAYASGDGEVMVGGFKLRVGRSGDGLVVYDISPRPQHVILSEEEYNSGYSVRFYTVDMKTCQKHEVKPKKVVERKANPVNGTNKTVILRTVRVYLPVADSNYLISESKFTRVEYGKRTAVSA